MSESLSVLIRTMARPVALVLLASSCLLAQEASAQRAASTDTKEEWHKLFLAGQLAGYVHITEKPLPDGGYSVSSFQKLVLKRGQTKIETEALSSQDEDRNGQVRAFKLRQKFSSEPRTTEGRLEGDSFRVVETTGEGRSASSGDKAREWRLPADPLAVGAHFAEKLQLEKLKKPGDTVSMRIFIPDLLKFGKQTSALERMEEIDTRAGKRALARIKSTVDALANIETLQWVDTEGNLERSKVLLLGMELVTVRSSVEEVLKSDFTSPPEIFFASSVPVQGKVDSSARRITYKISAKGEARPFQGTRKLFPAAGEAESRPGTATERWLQVHRVEPGAALKLPLSQRPELEEYLRPNGYIQSDDEEIRSAARKAVGGETDAFQAAAKLERWVRETITGKDLNTAFASAKEVLKQRTGDCTEHAVLLAALLRAVGIPSRVVAGLIHYEGAFAGHMWTEAFFHDWVPLDATLALGSVGPDHIALSVSSLENANVADVFLDIVPFIGSVRIEVVEIVP